MTSDLPQSLELIFERLKVAQYQGVSGVMRIESGKQGPVLGITVSTHGNEPSGLAVIERLLNEINIEKELSCGTLYLVVNNIKATERFFNATNENEIRESRYCDVNMNRLPKETLQLTNDTRYEVSRARELYPIWQQFNFGLDVHSTTDPCEPMIVNRGGIFHPDLVRGFPIKILISNIDTIQVGIPAFAFYGGLGSVAKVFCIEAGQHRDPDSFNRASICAISLLKNLGMLVSSSESVPMEYDEYYVESSIVFPDISFDFVKNFKSYDEIHKDDLLAKNAKGEEIRARFDGHLIMPTSRRGVDKDISEEVAFVSRPVKARRV